jgi:phage baseplate assembly protein V
MTGMNENEIHRRVMNMVRKGAVTDVAHTSALPTCRVSTGDLETTWLPWVALAAGETAEWNPPTVGEQVLVLSPSGDLAQGVVLRGLYSESSPTPSHSPDKHLRAYPDGAEVEYDHAAHALKVNLPAGATVLIAAPGSIVVHTQDATVKADAIQLDGNVTVTKSMTVKGPLAFESGMTGKSGGSGATMNIDGRADFTGEVTSKGKSLPHHSHREQGDGQLVGEPQ